MKHIRLAAFALLVPAAAAFALDTSEIKVTGTAVMPSLGATIDLVGDSALPTASRAAHSLEIGYAFGRGKDKQDVNAGERPIVFGGQTFTGPQNIDFDMNIRFADLAYRYRRYFGESQSFGVDGLIGVGWAGLGLRATGRTQTAAESLGNAGLVFGVGGLWRFARNTALQVRFVGLSTGAEEGVTSAARFDLGLTHALGRHAAVSAGLGSLSVHSAREDDRDGSSTKSPINASLLGLRLGFDVIF